jgi:hypothetical protein
MRTGEALCIAIVLCLIAYLSWRIWLWQTRFSWSRTLLIPAGQLSWKVSSVAENSAPEGRKRRSSARGRSDARAAVRAAAPDTPPAACTAAATLASIDPESLHSIEAATIEQLHSLNSISDYIRSSFHDISAASSQAWMQRLEDYVAEQQAAAALEKAGHAVQLHASQAGWRWLVDGQPIEVKDGVASVAGAKDAVIHLRFAAKTKGDLVNHISDFDHDAISTASKDAMSVVHEGFDAGLHIPFGTLLRSAWRELELLFDKKTPIERAVKHVAMDVASVGTGAYIGAKVGGGIGAVAGPVGVGAGLLVGAMAGAARSAVEFALEESKSEVQELESLFQKKFEAARGEIASAARRQLEEIERTQAESLNQFLRHFPAHLGALEAQLLHEEAAVLAEMPAARWWNWIFPRRQDLEKVIVRRWFKRAKKVVQKERRRFEKLKDGPVPALHSKVRRFLGTYTFSLRSFDDSLGSLANGFTESRAAAEVIMQTALDDAENVRNEMVVEIRGRVSKMYLVLGKTISGWREKVQVSLDELHKQARPLGIELPE